MENLIIVLVLLAAVLLGLGHGKKHFSGGGCCGSGSTAIRTAKTLTEPKIGQWVLTIQGMHCENCQARVENAVNHLEGVACVVNLEHKTATVSYSREISREALQTLVENLGYQVTRIC